MIDVLRELYKGEVYPAKQIDIEDESFQAVLQQHAEAKQEFRKGLSETQLRQFDDPETLQNKYGREYDILNFRKGFQIEIQCTMGGLKKDRLDGVLKQE